MGRTVGWPFVSAVDLLIAAGVALLAGGINSIAGGGSLILFPTLIGLGLGTVPANVTNSIAQWPGYIGGGLGVLRADVGERARQMGRAPWRERGWLSGVAVPIKIKRHYQ